VKVKYLRDVTSPREQQGKAGEVKDLPDRIARLLLAGRFVEKVNPKPGTEEKEHETGGRKKR